MAEAAFKLKNPPIVEAMLDIECDMPGRELAAVKLAADQSFLPQYPKFEVFYPNSRILGEAPQSAPQPVPAMPFQHDSPRFQYAQEDGKQLIQIQTGGYSFNRLAPYTTLDNYLQEIERTWKIFVRIAEPIEVRAVRLRFINRIPLPIPAEKLDLKDYLKIGPRLPDEVGLKFVSFFDQHTMVETDTGNLANIILATLPAEGNRLPLLFDIAAAHDARLEPTNWRGVSDGILSLRRLKNLIFRNTLTERCLKLFQ